MAARNADDPGRDEESTGPLDPEEIAQRFEALAHPRRVELLRFLREPHYLREVASHLGVSRQAAHHHLQRLVDDGLLERREGRRASGTVTEYVVAPEALAPVHDAVERVQGNGARSPGEHPRAREGGPPPAQTPPQPRGLWVLRGLDAGAVLDLPRGADGPWSVGRDGACDLVLEADPYVAARHAEVWRDGDGYRIQDLASTDGVRHNGRRLDRRGETRLRHGDVLGLGRSLILYWDGRR